MMKKIYIILSILIATLNVQAADSYAKTKDIIIVNSYDKNIEWSDNLSNNLSQYISKHFPEYAVKQFDLGINNNYGEKTDLICLKAAISKNNIKNKLINFKKEDIFASLPPDLLIFIGNEGWLLYRSLYNYMPNNWKNTPILLTGVDNKIFKNTNIYQTEERERELINIEDSKYIGDFEFNISAVTIKKPILENINYFIKLMPSLKNIILLSDEYYTSKLDNYKIKKLTIKRNIKTFSNSKDKKQIEKYLESQNTHNLYITSDLGNENLFYNLFFKKSRFYYNSRNQTKPIYSINQNSNFDKYLLGGKYIVPNNLAYETENLLFKILKNNSPAKIPFTLCNSYYINLNKRAALCYLNFDSISNIDRINFYEEPMSFYYSNYMLVNFILFIAFVLIAIIIYIYFQKKNIKSIKKESKKYKDLIDHIRFVFSNIEIRFAIFDMEGKKINTFENTNVPNIIYSKDNENIFNNPFITPEIKTRIKNKETITRYINFYKKDNKSYKIIIQPVETIKNKDIFIAFTIDYSQISQKKIDNKTLKTMIDFATRKSKIGIAYFYPKTGKGSATDTWYENLGIDKKDVKDFKFSFDLYSHIKDKEVKDKIINYIQNSESISEHKQLNQETEINSYNGRHWIKESIEIHNYSTPQKITLVLDLNMNIDYLKSREKELIVAKKKTEAAKKDTNDFLANVSHEIRTPLNAILGFSNIILSSSNPEEIKPYKSIIQHNNETLTITINNILDLSKIDSGKMSINPSKFNLNTKFQELETYAKMQLNDKPLEIELKIPKGDNFIESDILFFDRLMTNLISNSIKFTNSGKITIGFELKKNYYFFFVTDTGIGISKENQNLIFNRFYKVDRFIEGTGLGLAFCQSIVSILGGEICLESKLGFGSTFSFDLPINFH